MQRRIVLVFMNDYVVYGLCIAGRVCLSYFVQKLCSSPHCSYTLFLHLMDLMAKSSLQ